MKSRLPILGIIAVWLTAATSSVVTVAGTPGSSLPSPENAKAILDATTRHREWVDLTVGSGSTLAFVVHPERADKAGVVVVNARNEGASEWTRAIADQIAAEGFIAIVPEVSGFASSDAVAEAARTYATALPAASGRSATLNVDATLTPATWPQVIRRLSDEAGSLEIHDHAAHLAMLAAAQQPGGRAPSRVIPDLGEKRPELPASYYTATATLARSKLRREWVDIPVGDARLHTWVEYPEGNNPAGVVIVMQHGVGLDDWMRSVADQLALQGFIAVAPDTWSGTGPNGENRDAFTFADDAMRAAAGKINAEETQRRYRAARDWALKLPRANGKSGSIGFCAGGGNSFRFAADVPELNAAVVFYGTAPAEDLIAKINAPVLGLYGENDARVTATVEPTAALMKKHGKSYESHIYPKTTHSFVFFQDLGANREALADAWPRVIAFYNQHLK
ncbi:MAG: dienelactone hydrolase family protein [Vicinamibacterales bacterium]